MDNRTVLPVWDTISEGWAKVYGAKATILGAFCIVILIMVGFGVLRFLGEHLPPSTAVAIVIGIVAIIAQLVQMLLQYGLYNIGIRRANDEPIRYDMVFRPFEGQLAWRLIILSFLVALIVYLPAIIFFFLPAIFPHMGVNPPSSEGILRLLTAISYIVGILWVIYAAIRTGMALGFVLDQQVNPLEAVKLSWRATKGNVLPLLGILILSIIIFAVSIIPLGIGLIWTIPWGVVLYGVIYHRLKVNALYIPTTTGVKPSSLE